MGDRLRPQANRTVLGLLLALLFVAVLLALWFLIFDGDDTASDTTVQRDVPTALPIPTSTSGPVISQPAEPAPTPTPAVTPTPIPAGFEACAADRMPLTTTNYIVDTNTVPLNQRSAPAVGADLVGTFDPAQANLVFTGDCVKNVEDGYTWWKIFNGNQDVWIASDFVTPN